MKQPNNERLNQWRRWRRTLGAQQLYRQRPGLVEYANAILKNRYGLDKLYVRGMAKVTSVAVMAGIAFNIMQHVKTLAA